MLNLDMSVSTVCRKLVATLICCHNGKTVLGVLNLVTSPVVASLVNSCVYPLHKDVGLTI